MRAAQLLSYALLSSTISAWSMQDLVDSKAVQGIEGLFKRADTTDATSAMTSAASAAASSQSKSEASSTDDSSDDDSSKPTSTMGSSKSTDSSDSSAASSTDSSDSSSAKSSGSATTKALGSSGSSKTTTNKSSTGKSTAKSSGKTTASSTQTYNSTDGYGGVSMISPNPTSSSSYYKIGNYLTFAWNFTSLSITPTAIDILATCTANSATYTIAMNQSVTASTGAVTWDTGDYQNTAQVPLLTDKYTLMIHDASKDVTASAEYGGLSAYTAFAFAMYTKQPYTGLSEGWQCVTCSGAMSQGERQTMAFMFGMAAIAIASFTWFAGSFGVY